MKLTLMERMDGLYDVMDAMELSIQEVENRLFNIKQQKNSGDNVYQFLLYFDKLQDKMTEGEKKDFVKSFVDEVYLYQKEQEEGRFLKHIKFKFPVFFNGIETEELDLDNESTVETVVLLHQLIDDKVNKYRLEIKRYVDSICVWISIVCRINSNTGKERYQEYGF